MVLRQIQKTAMKFSTKSSGILGNSASGIGTNRLMRFVDNTLVGGRLASIGFPVPFLGSVDLIDGFNYLVHAGGFKVKKQGIVALAAAKVEQGLLPLVPSLLSGVSSPTGSQTPNISSSGANF